MEQIVFDSPMNGASIAEVLNITRQDVSQLLKRALRKIFTYLSNDDPYMSDFEIIVYISQLLNVEQTPEDLNKFYKLFPGDIRKKIKESALGRFSDKQKTILRDGER
jgi:hypothetical protein